MSEAFPDWQRQLQAASSKSPDAKHAFVATTRPDGTPAVRAMGFLGFAKGSSDVILQTHAQSHKAEHLQHNPCVEICIYAHKTSEQFRIRGKLTVIGPGQSDEALCNERQRQWALPMPSYVRAKYFRLEDDQRQHEDPILAAQVAAAFRQKPNGQDKALLWRKQDVNP
eukprot:jgi/Astpho2/8756/Aster-x1542